MRNEAREGNTEYKNFRALQQSRDAMRQAAGQCASAEVVEFITDTIDDTEPDIPRRTHDVTPGPHGKKRSPDPLIRQDARGRLTIAREAQAALNDEVN